jgi:hypothetical protein
LPGEEICHSGLSAPRSTAACCRVDNHQCSSAHA